MKQLHSVEHSVLQVFAVRQFAHIAAGALLLASVMPIDNPTAVLSSEADVRALLLMADLRQLGVAAGDLLWCHSSLNAVLKGPPRRPTAGQSKLLPERGDLSTLNREETRRSPMRPAGTHIVHRLLSTHRWVVGRSTVRLGQRRRESG